MTTRIRIGARAVVVLVMFLVAGCAEPRNSLGTPASPCFRSLPAARAVVRGRGRLVGVRLVRASTYKDRVPGAATLGRERLCLVAFRGPYRGNDVGIGRAGDGRYAIVVMSARRGRPVDAVVVDRLPIRFAHRR